ncbi:MAG: glycosyltransferase 87 family protein [Actinomycetota bacterium]
MRAVRRTSAWAIVLVVAGLLFEGTIAAAPLSPLQPVLAPGAGPSGPFSWLARALGISGVHGNAMIALSVAALALAAAAFLYLLAVAWRAGISLRAVLVLAVLANLAVWFLPLLASRDVYSYIGYGNIISVHHANPYVQTPADFPADAVARLVGPKWFDTPAVYGPAFSSLSGVMTRAVTSVAGQVAAFRALAVAASLGTIALIASSARRVRPELAAFAVAAFGLNPVVLFQSVGSGHNDLLVALAAAGAFALLLRDRELPAIAVLTLGALVKATGAIPLLLVIIWCIARRPAGDRLRAGAGRIGVAAAITLAFAAPFFQLHDPTLGMFELAGHQGWLAPSRLIARLADAVGGGTPAGAVRLIFAAALLLAVLMLARRVASGGAVPDEPGAQRAELGAALGWSLVLLMLLGPVLLPWYVTWGLPLAWLLPRVPRTVLLGVSTALAVSLFVAEPDRYPHAYNARTLIGHYVIAPLVAIGLGWLLVDGIRRFRAGAPLRAGEGGQEIPASTGGD